jgi:hypothetical protein
MSATKKPQNVEYPNYAQLESSDEGKLVWDEYQYRHDLIWRHLIRSTLALVGLVTVGFSTAFDPTDSLIKFAWAVALGYWGVTLFVIEPELCLLTKIRNLHRDRQKHCFGLVNKITPFHDKMKWGTIFSVDHFAQRVGFYLFLLLIATLLALPVALF